MQIPANQLTHPPPPHPDTHTPAAIVIKMNGFLAEVNTGWPASGQPDGGEEKRQKSTFLLPSRHFNLRRRLITAGGESNLLKMRKPAAQTGQVINLREAVAVSRR